MPAATATVGYCYDSDEDGEARGGGAARWTRDTGRVPLAARSCDACNHAGEHAHGLAAHLPRSTCATGPAPASSLGLFGSRAARPRQDHALPRPRRRWRDGALVAQRRRRRPTRLRVLPPASDPTAGLAPRVCHRLVASDAARACGRVLRGARARGACRRCGWRRGGRGAASARAHGAGARLCESAVCGLEAVCDATQPALAAVEGTVAPCVQPIGALMHARGQGAGLRAPVLRVLAGLERLGLALRSASAVVEEHMQPISAALDARLGKLATRSSASKCARQVRLSVYKTSALIGKPIINPLSFQAHH